MLWLCGYLREKAIYDAIPSPTVGFDHPSQIPQNQRHTRDLQIWPRLRCRGFTHNVTIVRTRYCLNVIPISVRESFVWCTVRPFFGVRSLQVHPRKGNEWLRRVAPFPFSSCVDDLLTPRSIGFLAGFWPSLCAWKTGFSEDEENVNDWGLTVSIWVCKFWIESCCST